MGRTSGSDQWLVIRLLKGNPVRPYTLVRGWPNLVLKMSGSLLVWIIMLNMFCVYKTKFHTVNFPQVGFTVMSCKYMTSLQETVALPPSCKMSEGIAEGCSSVGVWLPLSTLSWSLLFFASLLSTTQASSKFLVARYASPTVLIKCPWDNMASIDLAVTWVNEIQRTVLKW